jgi:uncharacterized damage-inducible protein DinB
MAFREALLAEYDHEVAATRRMLAQIPALAMPWRPHERSRSTAQLVAHLTDILTWSKPILDGERFDLADADRPSVEADSPASALQRFADVTREARRHIDKSDAELTAMWTLLQGGRELFSLPRAAAFRTFVLAHVVHHRGQLSVYLRLNDAIVSPLYGPTADSGAPRKVSSPAERRETTSDNGER